MLRWISLVPGPDRRRLVVEPRPLPRAVAGVVVGAVPQRRGRAEHGHHGVVQALAHLAPVELERAALGPGRLALGDARQRAPVVQLEQAHLDGRLREPRAEPVVVERTRLEREPQQLLEELDVDDELARVDAALVRERRVRDAPALVDRADPLRRRGRTTSAKNTSLNSDSSVIWRSGRTSTPAARMSTASAVMPCCLGTSGFGAGEAQAPVGELRVARPDLLAVEDPAAVGAGRRAWSTAARSLPAPGSLNSWHQSSSAGRISGSQRAFCSGVPCASSVGPTRLMPMRPTSSGRGPAPAPR